MNNSQHDVRKTTNFGDETANVKVSKEKEYISILELHYI